MESSPSRAESRTIFPSSSSDVFDDSLFRSRLAAIEAIQNAFARSLAQALSGDLSARIEGRGLPAFQLPYHEFRLTLSNPTFLTTLGARQFVGQMCVEITPRLGYLLLERMLGGGDAEPLVPRRPFTMIESRLIGRVVDRIIEHLSAAFAQYAATDFYAQATEATGAANHIVPPEEWVTVVPVELYIGRHGGRLTLCLPACATDRLPASEGTPADHDGSPRCHHRGLNTKAGDEPAAVDLIGVLAETTLKLSELRTLQVGDIITTDLPANGEVTLLADDAPAYLGQLVKFRGHRAIAVMRRV